MRPDATVDRALERAGRALAESEAAQVHRTVVGRWRDIAVAVEEARDLVGLAHGGGSIGFVTTEVLAGQGDLVLATRHLPQGEDRIDVGTGDGRGRRGLPAVEADLVHVDVGAGRARRAEVR